MKKYSNSMSLIIMVIIFRIATTLVHAQELISSPKHPNAHFDVIQIVEQISHNPTMPHLHDANRFENAKVPEWSRDGEFLIDTAVVYQPIAYDQFDPAIAFDGTNYLVVWWDFLRNRIYGTRVNQSGNPLDPGGIGITSLDGWYHPSVAFDGTNYLVVWSDGENIYGARVDTTGSVLDPNGIAISTATGRQRLPSVAFTDTTYLVTWWDTRSGVTYDIYGARVSRSGIVLDPNGIVIATTCPATWQYSSVASDGTNFLVVWEDIRLYGSIYGALVDQSGNIVKEMPISYTEYGGVWPSVAFDGINYLVVWIAPHYNQPWEVYGARVDQSGNVLDSNVVVIAGLYELFYTSVAFDGVNFLVVSEDVGVPGIVGVRVDQSGVVIDTTSFTILEECFVPSVAADGTNCLVVCYDASYSDICGARVDQSGNVLDTTRILLSVCSNPQYNPAVTFDGTNFLAVWEDGRDLMPNIYGARVDQSGSVLDSIPIAIALGFKSYPSVAFGGTNFLVTWEKWWSYFSAIYGTRVSQSGVILDTLEIQISEEEFGEFRCDPQVAFDGTNYLVAWSHTFNDFTDIHGARVDQSGNVLDHVVIPISTAIGDQCYPSVAFDGVNYLVVWEDARNGLTDIYGAQIDQSGNILDPLGIPISTALNAQKYPSIVFDGTNYFVVWEDARNGLTDIYGAQIDQSGNILDTVGIPISVAAGNQRYPSVAFNGTDYVAIWQDDRNGSWDIYGAKLNTSGIVIDTFSISLQPGDQILPALAHGAGEQFLITYSGWTEEYGGKTYNNMRIWGKFYPSVGVEEYKASHPYATMLQVSPNPFRHTTNIRYTIHDPGNTINQGNQDIRGSVGRISEHQKQELRIHDAVGRLVKSFSLPTTYYLQPTVISWSGIDDANRRLPSGVYFVTLRAGEYAKTEKVLLIR